MKLPEKTSLVLIHLFCFISISAQEKGVDRMNTANLKSTINYIAADKMKGRKTGEKENDLVANYLAKQAAEIGLKPLGPGESFLQPFQLTRTFLKRDSCSIELKYKLQSSYFSTENMIVNPLPSSDLSLSGNVVFAGYGITSPDDEYFDLKGLDIKDKILLVLDRAPSSPDGKKCLLKDDKWMTSGTLDLKYVNLISFRPKAILMVVDPKSGHHDIEEIMPGITQDLAEKFTINGTTDFTDLYMNSLPKLFVISQEMADSLLKPANENLRHLQNIIDSMVQPHSFEIPDIQLSFALHVNRELMKSNNVAGIIKSKDTSNVKDAIIYTAHFDHIGIDDKGKINNGADDNGSGTAALLEIAKAFSSEQNQLKRNIIILWTSGEELGLVGSKFYVDNPLFPLENTLADINLDMIGRSWTSSDTGMERGELLDVKKGDSLYVAGGKNCPKLLTMAEQSATLLGLSLDYKYNSPDDPSKMYFRSDHYNFALKRVPAVFLTTGLHKDYHSPRDLPSKLDYEKMLKVTKMAYYLGFKIATMDSRLQPYNY